MTMTDTMTRHTETLTGALAWQRASAPVPYGEALAAMERQVAAIRAEGAPETVWQLEHPGVLTAGTSARDGDLLDAGGLPVHRTGRGGQWTWHGPGQRIGYVMLDLTRAHGRIAARDVRAYVHGLEDWLIEALARLGVRGETRPDRVGIWVVDPATGAERKIAAIGVRVTRWVSWHGVALNVDPDLGEYARIVPCGIAAHGVTSLAALGVSADAAKVDRALREAWGQVFG